MSFYGRENELEALRKEYKKVNNGCTILITIIGDTGLGKTRIVQEFYNYLSEKEDLNNYWPKKVDESTNSMNIVPNFISLHKALSDEMTYLWLGLRCSNPSLRNSMIKGESALNPLRKQIGLHLVSFYEKEEKKMKRTGISKGLLSIIANFAFPGGGPVVLKAIGEVVSNIDTGLSTYDSIKSIVNNINEDGISDSTKVINNQQYNSLVEQSIEVFSIVLSGNKGVNKVPILLVIDDIHWADDNTISFIEKLIIKGNENEWPLMILTTSWETELKKQRTEDTENVESYGSMLKKIEKSGYEHTEINLLPLADQYIDNIIKENIKKADKDVIEVLRDSSSGDLELLFESFRRIKETPGYIKTDGTLAVDSTKLKFKSYKKKEIIRERLQELGIELLTISSWGSIQGRMFTKEYINRCIIKCNEFARIDKEVFERLQDPENIAMIEKCVLGEIAEYKREIYYEISKEISDDLPYKEELVELLLEYYAEIISEIITKGDSDIDNNFIRTMYEDFINISNDKKNKEYRDLVDHSRVELAYILLYDGLFQDVINISEPVIFRQDRSKMIIEILQLLIEASIGIGNYNLEKKYIDILSVKVDEKDEIVKNYYLAKYYSRSNGEKSVYYAEKLKQVITDDLPDALKFKYYEQIIVSYFYGGYITLGIETAKKIDDEFIDFMERNPKSKIHYNHTIGLLLHNIDKNVEVSERAKNAFEGYKMIGDNYNYLLSCVNYADALMGSGQIQKSLKVMEKSYIESIDSNYIHAKNIASICYANILSYFGLNSRALHYYKKGINFSREIEHGWDELYGEIWEALCISEFSDFYANDLIKNAINKAKEKKYDYLEELSQTFYLLIMWNLRITSKRGESIAIYESLDAENVPGMKLQALSYNILNGHLKFEDYYKEFVNLLRKCEGVKGRPEIIKKVYEESNTINGLDNEYIETWILKYVDPIIVARQEHLDDWKSNYPEEPNLNYCNFHNCEAMCCYDGVYLEEGEENKISTFIKENLELFIHLPDEYICDGNWKDVMKGRKTAVREFKYKNNNFPKHFNLTRCVFAYDNGVCSLQYGAMRKGIHPWGLKPKACWMFPINGTGSKPITPPRANEIDPDYIDSSYPGFVKFLPCGVESIDGKSWSEVYMQEIDYLKLKDEIKD